MGEINFNNISYLTHCVQHIIISTCNKYKNDYLDMLHSVLDTMLLKSFVHFTLTSQLKSTTLQVLKNYLGPMADTPGILLGFQEVMNKCQLSLILCLCMCCYSSSLVVELLFIPQDPANQPHSLLDVSCPNPPPFFCSASAYLHYRYFICLSL